MAQVFGKEQIHELEWPNTPEAARARSFLLPLMEEGVPLYIENVHTELYVLKLDDFVIPLTVNEKEYNNSYVTSNYYFVHAMREESRNPLLTTLASGALKWFQINKVVILNNWLLSNNLFPKLTDEQLKRAIACLTDHFPKHFIMVRNVSGVGEPDFPKSLKTNNFRILDARDIFVYDPSRKAKMTSKARNHLRRDSRLVEEYGYEVIRKADLAEADFERILELYLQVYVQGFTRFSPLYTKNYLKHALESDLFEFIGVRKEGRIDGIFAYYTLGDVMTAPFFGYDKGAAEAKVLYRMVSILMIEECERLGLLLNNGSGGDSSKLYRGMTPHPEYVAIYDRHLPFLRRLFWMGAEALRINKGRF